MNHIHLYPGTTYNKHRKMGLGLGLKNTSTHTPGYSCKHYGMTLIGITRWEKVVDGVRFVDAVSSWISNVGIIHCHAMRVFDKEEDHETESDLDLDTDKTSSRIKIKLDKSILLDQIETGNTDPKGIRMIKSITAFLATSVDHWDNLGIHPVYFCCFPFRNIIINSLEKNNKLGYLLGMYEYRMPLECKICGVIQTFPNESRFDVCKECGDVTCLGCICSRCETCDVVYCFACVEKKSDIFLTICLICDQDVCIDCTYDQDTTSTICNDCMETT